MILSLSPTNDHAGAAGITLAAASVVALVGYAAAALPGERLGTRYALLLGWIAHGLAIVVDVAGIGSPLVGARFGFAPALSMTIESISPMFICCQVRARFKTR